MLNVNLAHSFAKHHDVISTDFNSSRFSHHEQNPHVIHETPSAAVNSSISLCHQKQQREIVQKDRICHHEDADHDESAWMLQRRPFGCQEAQESSQKALDDRMGDIEAVLTRFHLRTEMSSHDNHMLSQAQTVDLCHLVVVERSHCQGATT